MHAERADRIGTNFLQAVCTLSEWLKLPRIRASGWHAGRADRIPISSCQLLHAEGQGVKSPRHQVAMCLLTGSGKLLARRFSINSASAPASKFNRMPEARGPGSRPRSCRWQISLRWESAHRLGQTPSAAFCNQFCLRLQLQSLTGWPGCYESSAQHLQARSTSNEVIVRDKRSKLGPWSCR